MWGRPDQRQDDGPDVRRQVGPRCDDALQVGGAFGLGLSAPGERTGLDTRGERERLTAALAGHGSIRASARALGIGESTLRGRLKRHGIEAPSGRGWKSRAAAAA